MTKRKSLEAAYIKSMEQEIAAVKKERDALKSALSSYHAVGVPSPEAFSALEAEREGLEEELAAERDALKEVWVLKRERDALKAELEDVLQHRQSICGDYTALNREFKGLLEERDVLEARLDALLAVKGGE